MAFDILKQLCISQLSEFDSSDSAVTTYAVLWDEGALTAERFLPCPICWAKESALVKCAAPNFMCSRCATRLADVD